MMSPTTLIRMTFRRALTRMGWPKWLSHEITTQSDGTVIEHERRDMYAIATLFDMMAERVRLGVRYQFPGLGPSDALAQKGKDLRVLRGPSESDEAYAARLIRAKDDQRMKGSPEALLRQVAGYFSPFSVLLRTVDNSGNWTTLNTDGTITYNYFGANWNWDGNTSAWGRYWLIVYPLSTGAFADAGLWGTSDGQQWGETGNTFGSTLTQDQVESLKRLMREWRPEGRTAQWVILAFDAASFVPTAAPNSAGLPDGTWGSWGKYVAGVKVAARLSTARYIEVGP